MITEADTGRGVGAEMTRRFLPLPLWVVICGLVTATLACERNTAADASAGEKGAKGSTGEVGLPLSEDQSGTVSMIRSLDQLRLDAFEFAVALPSKPAEFTTQPGETAFAASERRQKHEQDLRAYNAALTKTARDVDAYVKSFERSWGRLSTDDALPAKKMTALDKAVRTGGSVRANAGCRVVEVVGSCDRVCMQFSDDSGLGQVGKNVCEWLDRNGRGQYEGMERLAPYWAHSCEAQFVCSTGSPIGSQTAGLKYEAVAYVVEFNKRYQGKTAEADAAVFRDKIGAVKPGDNASFPKVRSWRFSRAKPQTWYAEANADDGWPTTTP